MADRKGARLKIQSVLRYPLPVGYLQPTRRGEAITITFRKEHKGTITTLLYLIKELELIEVPSA